MTSQYAELVVATHNALLYFVLVNELKDVWGVDEYADGSADGNRQEYVQLQSVNYRSNVPPVVKYLRHAKTSLYTPSKREWIGPTANDEVK